jgi:Glycosyl transferase family 2
MSNEFRVIALIAAYNEGDIIGQVIDDLIRQNVQVYLIDDGSTDDTATAAEPFLDKGLIHIERRIPNAEESQLFSWTQILLRKQQLATELDANWFIHHDADELRESPWASLTLHDALQQVDQRGYNAVDFKVLNFRPTHHDYHAGDDMRRAFTWYEPGREWDGTQIKCWKKTEHAVDLVSSGGHDVGFPGRRVFPLRFLLRHYPIRGQAHGEHKIFIDRKPRFVEAERDRGWHVQYDAFESGQTFIWKTDGLVQFDPDLVRVDLSLQNRDVQDLQGRVATLLQEKENLEQTAQSSRAEADARQAEIQQRDLVIASHIRELDGRRNEIAQLTDLLQETRSELKEQRRVLRDEIDAALAEGSRLSRELASVYASRSWQVTRPLRAIFRLLTGR